MNIRQPGEGFEHEARVSGRAKNGTKFPLKASAKGAPIELVLDPTNAVQSDPSKGLGIRTHSPLTVSPGSQPALTLDLGESMAVVDKRLEARPKIADVQGLDASLTVGRDALTAIGTALASEISDRGTADTTINATIAALKVMRASDFTTVDGTNTVTVTTGVDMRDPTFAFISLTPYSAGSLTPGIVRVVALANGSFDLVSDSPSDDQQVLWAVFA